jgi:L-lysine 2,3-aminomutase
MMAINQSVLLKEVNDSAETLAELSRGLFDAGVLPYYLHHPDRAAGTGHFDLSMERGLAIHAELKARLPGYLVPRYVVDIVGEPAKTDVATVVPR